MNVKRLAALGLILGSGGIVTVGCTVGGSSSGGAGGTTGTTTSSSKSSSTASGSTTATGTTGSTTATGMGSTTSTGMALCPSAMAPAGATVGTTDCGMMPCTAASTCDAACSALYDCGLAKCGTMGAQLCPGMPNTGTSHDGFITAMQGCRDQCMANGGLKSLIDPTDCKTTIDTLSNLNAGFKAFCQGAGGG